MTLSAFWQDRIKYKKLWVIVFFHSHSYLNGNENEGSEETLAEKGAFVKWFIAGRQIFPYIHA